MHVDKPEQEWREEFSTVMTTYAPGSEAERRLVRKIDLHIVRDISELYYVLRTSTNGYNGLQSRFPPYGFCTLCRILTEPILVYPTFFFSSLNTGAEDRFMNRQCQVRRYGRLSWSHIEPRAKRSMTVNRPRTCPDGSLEG